MSQQEWKVLIIDDDPSIRRVMTISMEDAGFRVFSAPDGETGIEVCRKESPHIVITDIRMPGIDGIEVLKRIKEMEADTEVIVATAFSEIDFAVKALQLDASDFITKPIGDEALMVALRRATQRYTTRRELRDYTALIEERWMETAEELAKTFHFQEMLIESSIDGIVACDKSGKVIVFNKSMEDMLGYTKKEFIRTKSLDELFSEGEADRFRNKLFSEEFGGRNRLFLFETTLVSRAEVKIPCQVSATVMFDGEEEAGIVVFFRDQREIRKLAQQVADQARLLHQDKMISLGKLAASVVHEINNPISGILNYTRLMLKILAKGVLQQDSISRFQNYLSLMEGELSRCSKIVSNLLAFSRMPRVEFVQIDINELLKRCIALSEHKLTLQNIRIEVCLQERLPTVLGDFNQLQQCVINLIFNAIDAMPEGGLLQVKSSFDLRRNWVEIQVRDTGCGIAVEDQPYIFDPFFTTKKEGKGLGLGLSTVYGIVDRHKGTISVVSEVGRGSNFMIRLPAGRV
ncbi:MAG: response regulator [Syntrophobacteraceae bacterium]|nr:response regulator [Syntrophobacteraceae bacterium]